MRSSLITRRTLVGGRRTQLRRWAVAFLLFATAAVLGGIPAYVRPQLDPLRPADAIVVLGGVDPSRYSLGIELANEGWAPALVFSNPLGAKDEWMTQECSTPHSGYVQYCFVPDPQTTRGEGRELNQLAAQHGWHHLIVVTFTPHISRARFVLEHCFSGELTMVASPGSPSLPRLAFEYVYQTVGYVKSMPQRGC